MRTREKAISRAKLETEIERTPVAYITEEQVKAIQDKEWPTLKEAAQLLNVSPLTLRRWTQAGKVKSEKIGRKHLFQKRDL